MKFVDYRRQRDPADAIRGAEGSQVGQVAGHVTLVAVRLVDAAGRRGHAHQAVRARITAYTAQRKKTIKSIRYLFL